MAVIKINFTEKALTNLAIPTNKRAEYVDTNQKYLRVQVFPSGIKTFYFVKRLETKVLRIKLGRVGELRIPEARTKVIEILNQISNGVDPTEKKGKLNKNIMFKDFFNKYYMELHSIPNKTINSQKKDICLFKNNLKDIHNTRFVNLTGTTLINLHNNLKNNISVYTANRAIALVKSMYNKAKEWDLLPTTFVNPANKVKMPEEKARTRFLRPEEVDKFFSYLENYQNKTLRNFVHLALYIGARKNEILSLKWEDVMLDTGDNGIVNFKHTKNGESISIALNEYAKKVISTMKTEADPNAVYLFPSSKNPTDHLKNIRDPWNKFRKEIGMSDLHIHDLRRTLGTYTAMSGHNQKAIQGALGHKSMRSTNSYVQFMPSFIGTVTGESIKYMFDHKK